MTLTSPGKPPRSLTSKVGSPPLPPRLPPAGLAGLDSSESANGFFERLGSLEGRFDLAGPAPSCWLSKHVSSL
ncbi:unnamed protein product, partial [Chrysoparadoxa australica]